MGTLTIDEKLARLRGVKAALWSPDIDATAWWKFSVPRCSADRAALRP